MKLDRSTIKSVMDYCLRDILPIDANENYKDYPELWFEECFNFLENEKLEAQLGDAFYQARLLYKLMSGLRFNVNDQSGVLKFQIIQYASICEALLHTAIEAFFQKDFQKRFAITEMRSVHDCLPNDFQIKKGDYKLFLCKQKTVKADIIRERITNKTAFAVEKGIITQDSKDKLDALYDLRNNIHIIKAAKTGYKPTLKEAQNGFENTLQFIREVSSFYAKQMDSDEIE